MKCSHASKERKNKKINEIQQAQVEAKGRAAKRKRLQQAFHPSKAVQQNHITTDEDYEDGLEPIINVNIRTDQILAHALVDSGAHINTISWNLYNQLPELQLRQEPKTLMGFNGNQSISPGYVILMVTVKGLPCPSKYFVLLPADALENQLTLGA